jgi:hypothetical protein
MRLIKKQIINNIKPVYVVTRGGRRVEEKNYIDKNEATYRAEVLIDMVKRFSPHEKDSIHIVNTSLPERIK